MGKDDLVRVTAREPFVAIVNEIPVAYSDGQEYEVRADNEYLRCGLLVPVEKPAKVSVNPGGQVAAKVVKRPAGGKSAKSE